MSTAIRIAILKTPVCLLACWLIGAAMGTRAADGPAPTAASRPTQESSQKPPQKPSFYLSEVEMRRFLSGERLRLDSPDAVRIANDWRGGRASISIQKPAPSRPRPAMVECDGVGTKCAAYDEAGNYLFALPNSRVKLVVNDPDTLNCGHTSDLMSSFERADRCRGIGVLIPSIWESPRRRYAP